jgi:hypothetical protein
MDSVPTTIGEQFSLLFDGGDDFVFLKKEALSGRLKHYEYVHFVAWQVLLGVLPSEKKEGSNAKAIERWESECLRWREEYSAMKSELVVNPHNDETDSEANDATMDNPLSTGESSTWAQYFANSELRKDIFRDVDRTYPEIDFFRESHIQEMLTMILFVYAKRHPQLAYKQGMHEICALPLYIAHRERILRVSGVEQYKPDEQGKHNYSSLIKTLYDPKFIEHDLYHLFSKMLDHLGPYYQQSRSHQTSNPLETSSASNGSSADENSSSNGSAVLRKCRLIQDVLLKKHDEQLSNHLSDIELEPQLYLLRWIRILFGREFHLEDTVTVWDSVFAFDDHFGFIDHMAVAMLIFIRSQLLARDFADCIKRLQKYPPVEDVTILVEHAIALTKPKPAGLVGPLPFPSSLQSSTPPAGAAPAASLVTVSNKSSASSTANSHPKAQHQATQGASQVASTPQKPVVYASPAYNAQTHQKHATPATQSYGSSAPKRAAPNASDAQILKATPLSTPPSSGALPRTQNHSSGSSHGSKLNETPMVTVPKAEWEELNRQVADSNVSRSKFTEKLNSVIASLQAVITSPEELSSQQITEVLVMTVAGLKRTRDIASGLLGDDDDYEAAMGMQLTSMSPKKDVQKLKLAPAPSSPAPIPPNASSYAPTYASKNANGFSTSANSYQAPQGAIDFGMLPPADTDEWGTFTPASGHVSNAYNTAGYNASHTAPPAKMTGPPTAIDIPASSEASKAAVSAIFD